MQPTYGALRFVGGALRVIAAIIFILGVIGALIMLTASSSSDQGAAGFAVGLGGALASGIGATVSALVLMASGEALLALADIAASTRATADAVMNR